MPSKSERPNSQATGDGRPPKFKSGVRRSKDGLFTPQHNLIYGRQKGGLSKPDLFRVLRVREIEKLIMDRHGHRIPDDVDDGDLYVVAVAHHLRAPGTTLQEALKAWWSRWAPHMSETEIVTIADDVFFSPRIYGADELARALGVTFAERERLSLRTIGSIDVTKEQREQIQLGKKQVRDREAADRKRRDRGAKPRAEYLATSLTRLRPWEAEGISRRTYERNHKRLALTADPKPDIRPDAKKAA